MGDKAGMATHPPVGEAELSSLKGKEAPCVQGRAGPAAHTAWPGFHKVVDIVRSSIRI